MGGVSSSRLVAAEKGEGVVFEGRLRSDGGGFCGQRMRLLAEPLDLSSSDGMFIDCEATNASGADPSKRVWKMAIRTKQDRGEVVRQAPFTPPATRTAVQMPFRPFASSVGLGMPGVPPLESYMTNETYRVYCGQQVRSLRDRCRTGRL